MTNTIKIVLAIVVTLVIGFVLGVYGAKNSNLGATAYDALHQVGDIYQGSADTLIFRNGVFQGAPIATTTLLTTSGGITNSGALTQSATSTFTGQVTIGTSGTAISAYKCATATWNPDSIGTSTVSGAATSTDIALAGAVMGDTCTGSLTSATTSAASINCFISGTATATIRLLNLGSTALDLATGTAKACYTH